MAINSAGSLLRRHMPGQMFAAVPAPALVIGGMVGSDLGSAVAKHLLDLSGAVTAAAVRLLFAGGIALLIWRPSLRIDRGALPAIAGLGASIAVMNVCFYEAIRYLPLGMAVTIDYLGPLVVALVNSRQRSDLVWAMFAAAGVVLLTWAGGSVSWVGVLFALGSAGSYGGYIVCSAGVGRRTSGHSGFALAMMFGALLSLPVVVLHANVLLSHPVVSLSGLAVAVVSSLGPFLAELEALRRMPTSAFGVLMSADPAVAAGVGLLTLGQELHIVQWAGIGLVVMASIGSIRAARPLPTGSSYESAIVRYWAGSPMIPIRALVQAGHQHPATGSFFG
ncbi:EamA family transporter [Nocardia alni]|uniref:EamA family transporter n=1 Tax=Nocardia alni TaxID=2815723 RepID=UPI0027E1D0E0|nr:EamA family transporter [Nocardia alni]